MTSVQKAVLVGAILGDAYIQPTGRHNARIRMEHSVKQSDYLLWKVGFFPDYFGKKPTTMGRFNPKYRKTYSYCRMQSITSPEIGELRKLFYNDKGKKVIPKSIASLLVDPLSLSVWFMDDGYYYKRDKMAYIYLANCSDQEFSLLTECLLQNFGLHPKLKHKKLGWCFLFSVEDTRRLIELVKEFIPECMKHKIGL